MNKLRAAVLGANDGIISVATALVAVLGVFGEREVFLTAVAVVLAGAISMAAGEFVSVSAQVNHEFDSDDLEIVTESNAPYQAAAASFLAFLVGGAISASMALLTHNSLLVVATALLLLITSAALTAKKSARIRSTLRLAFVGSIALGVSLAGNHILQLLEI